MSVKTGKKRRAAAVRRTGAWMEFRKESGLDQDREAEIAFISWCEENGHEGVAEIAAPQLIRDIYDTYVDELKWQAGESEQQQSAHLAAGEARE